MKVVVFGATGKTGSLVVDRAVAKGHQVTVVVRDLSRFNNDRVHVVQGDATNPADVLEALQDQHAVIEAIGGTTPWKTTQLKPHPSAISSPQ